MVRANGRRKSRGFTLVELAIVVVIIGIMATLAIFGVSKYIRRSKTAEAVHMIGAIKAGQEAFFDETFRYYDVSQGDMGNLYPSTGDWDEKIQWGGGNAQLAERWRTIGIEPEAPVQFRYSCVAGLPDSMPTDALIGDEVTYNLAALSGSPRHWYLVKAVADLDGNGIRSVFVGSSFTNEIFSQNPGE
jgi:prepilin-type N-terminal cleavage/methylation domain-containing protein